MHATPPIATDAHHVWIVIHSDESRAVDAARIAHYPGSQRFIALPAHTYNTSALMPIYPDRGDPITGFRWATTADVEAHPHLFTDTETGRS